MVKTDRQTDTHTHTDLLPACCPPSARSDWSCWKFARSSAKTAKRHKESTSESRQSSLSSYNVLQTNLIERNHFHYVSANVYVIYLFKLLNYVIEAHKTQTLSFTVVSNDVNRPINGLLRPLSLPARTLFDPYMTPVLPLC